MSLAEDTVRLVSCASKRDEESFRALYRMYAPKARGTLSRMVGSSHLDDLVQEVFVRVWKGLSKIKDPQAFPTWFYRVVWNVAMDARKNAAILRSREVTETDFGNETFETENGRVGFDVEDPNAMSFSKITAKLCVEKALAALEKDCRDVLVLAEFEQLSMDEIAAIVGVPSGTVKSRLFRARADVRNFLNSKGFVP